MAMVAICFNQNYEAPCEILLQLRKMSFPYPSLPLFLQENALSNQSIPSSTEDYALENYCILGCVFLMCNCHLLRQCSLYNSKHSRVKARKFSAFIQFQTPSKQQHSCILISHEISYPYHHRRGLFLIPDGIENAQEIFLFLC